MSKTKRSNIPATRAVKVSPIRERREAMIDEIARRRGQLAEAATKYLDPDRLIRVFLGLAQQTPEILDCERASVVAALATCSKLGLEPGNELGHVYLIPRKRHLTVQLGFRGLLELARRSGNIRRVNASAVYRWEVEAGLFGYTHEPPEIRHEWSPDAPPDPDTETIVGAYAVIETTDGARAQIWLSRAEIERRRAMGGRGDGAGSPVWRHWYAEMACKTAIRYLLSRGLVSMTSEMAEAFAAEDRCTEPSPPRTITPPGQYGAAVRQRLAQREATEVLPPPAVAESPPLLGDIQQHAADMGASPEQVEAVIAELQEAGSVPSDPSTWAPAHGEAILRRVEDVLS